MKTAVTESARCKHPVADRFRFCIKFALDLHLRFIELVNHIEVPGDTVGLFSHQIERRQRVKLLLGPLTPRFRIGLTAQRHNRTADRRAHHLQPFALQMIIRSSAQDLNGAVVEICQQLAFPVRPDVRSHGLNVRDGQHIQHSQEFWRTDEAGEIKQHGGISDVPAPPQYHRHIQVSKAMFLCRLRIK